MIKKIIGINIIEKFFSLFKQCLFSFIDDTVIVQIIKQQEAVFMVSINEKQVFQKLETMNKANLDRVAVFVKWLLQHEETAKTAPEKRRPLLEKSETNE